MKRFLIAAAAATTLAMPAGASAQDTADVKMAAACTTPVAYCVNQYVAAVNRLVANTCTVPVMTCVQEAVNLAFSEVDYAVNTARYYAYYGVDKVDDPPPVNDICYLIYGQPCAAAIF